MLVKKLLRPLKCPEHILWLCAIGKAPLLTRTVCLEQEAHTLQTAHVAHFINQAFFWPKGLP